MSQKEMSDESTATCVVCCQHINHNNKKAIYAIGSCDHSVCYECSTRMRVLCKQNECPICRQPLNQVVFTRSKHKKFEEFDLKKCIYHNNYGIYFEDEESLESYGKLLEHPCRKCKNRLPFKTVHDLTTHLRKEHEMFLCDLCVNNLKVFSNEFKYYSRKELVRHRKTGDPDERSHRGHPICTFCDVRYVDEDELHFHLRREHFYCHFCDPSGLSHFYGDYSALRDHFLSDHFLCKECDCQEEKFTCAFRSEIDLQVHIAQLHSQNMSKSDLKKAKTLSLDLFIRQRTGLPVNDQKRNNKREQRRPNNTYNNDDMEADLTADDVASSNEAASSVITQLPRPEDFPQLCTNATNVTNNSIQNNTEVKETAKSNRKDNSYSVYVSKNPKLNTTNDEEFPALPGSSSKSPQINSYNSLAYNKLKKQKPLNSNGLKAQVTNVNNNSQSKTINLIEPTMKSLTQKNQNTNNPLIISREEFPSLPVTKKKNYSRNSGQSSTKSNNNYESTEANKSQNIEWNNGMQFDNKNTNFEKYEFNKNSSEVSKLNDIMKSSDVMKTSEVMKSSNVMKSLSNFDEFPILETNKKKTTKSFAPPKPLTPKPNTPPPGLTPINKKNRNLSLSSVAQQVIINPTNENSMESLDVNEFCYINPIDFNERNQSLVREVEDVLCDRSKFLIFKETSKQFRQSLISGDQYYQKCIDLFGRKNFSAIFSELLVLLPDIQKQNQLLRAQQNELKNSKGAIPKGSKILNDSNSNEFTICPKCKQVLIDKDQSQHMSSH